jgi:hypothetical protein
MAASMQNRLIKGHFMNNLSSSVLSVFGHLTFHIMDLTRNDVILLNTRCYFMMHLRKNSKNLPINSMNKKDIKIFSDVHITTGG